MIVKSLMEIARLTALLVLCIATYCMVSTVGCSTVVAADGPITIDDIIGIEKIGQIAVSPNGESAAYLIVQAVTERDAYSIRLVVTLSQNTSKHDEIVRIEIPAVRTQSSDIWEDVGSNLTGGIVFTWEHEGSDLIYGVPNQGHTDLFQYAIKTKTKTYLWKVQGQVNKITDLTNDAVGYCIDHTPASASDIRDRPDPAYRYSGTTFHFNDKHPWQDGRSFDKRERPYFDPEAAADCFERNGNTQIIKPVSSDAVQVFDPRMPTAARYMPHKMGALLEGKTFQGNPVDVAYASPDGKHILFAADIPVQENSSFEGKSVYFVENVGGTHMQRQLFEISGQHEGGIHQLFWAPDSRAILCVREGLERTQIVRFDINSGRETTLLEADWAFDRPVWSLDRRYLYATREKPDVPKQLCRIDLVTGEMMLIDDINERFRGIEIPPHIAIRQVNRYGDELTGYLFYPPGFRGQSRLPFAAIRGQVWDGFCDGGTGVEFPGMVMAMKGYAVLFFEPGSKHFGDSKDGNATYSLLRWQSPIENLRLLIASLDTKGWIDPKKTAIAGLSYGADLVDYAAGFSDVFSVGAATTGDVEAPTNYFIFGTDKDNDNFVKRFGLPYPDLAGLPAWQAVSASLNASRSNMPLLFQPPDSEAWMTISQHIAWQHVGLPVETYVYPDEGHIKVHPLNRYYVMLRNLQWFDFWLLGIEDSSPQFADQFKRWEKMRDEWMSTKSKHAAAPSASPSTR